MAKVCPDCTNGRRGAKPCPTCNPMGGMLDRPAAALRRARNAATGKKTTVSNDGGRKTVTTRAGWLAPTVTKTSGKPKAAKKKPTRTAARAAAKASDPAPLLPACEACGQRARPLTVRRNRHVCLNGCGKAS